MGRSVLNPRGKLMGLAAVVWRSQRRMPLLLLQRRCVLALIKLSGLGKGDACAFLLDACIQSRGQCVSVPAPQKGLLMMRALLHPSHKLCLSIAADSS